MTALRDMQISKKILLLGENNTMRLVTDVRIASLIWTCSEALQLGLGYS